MGNGTDRREPEGSQLVEYEAWLETLEITHVPFEEQEDPTRSRKLRVVAEEWFLDNVFRSNDLRTTALYATDEDLVSELIGDCYYSVMDMSISERCEITGYAHTRRQGRSTLYPQAVRGARLRAGRGR